MRVCCAGVDLQRAARRRRLCFRTMALACTAVRTRPVVYASRARFRVPYFRSATLYTRYAVLKMSATGAGQRLSATSGKSRLWLGAERCRYVQALVSLEGLQLLYTQVKTLNRVPCSAACTHQWLYMPRPHTPPPTPVLPLPQRFRWTTMLISLPLVLSVAVC